MQYYGAVTVQAREERDRAENRGEGQRGERDAEKRRASLTAECVQQQKGVGPLGPFPTPPSYK